MTVRYLVQDLFQIPGRGPVTAGLLLEGVVRTGDVLRVAGTGNRVRVSFVDFHARQTAEGPMVGLQIHPDDAPGVAPGATLLSTAED